MPNASDSTARGPASDQAEVDAVAADWAKLWDVLRSYAEIDFAGADEEDLLAAVDGQ